MSKDIFKDFVINNYDITKIYDFSSVILYNVDKNKCNICRTSHQFFYTMEGGNMTHGYDNKCKKCDIQIRNYVSCDEYSEKHKLCRACGKDTNVHWYMPWTINL